MEDKDKPLLSHTVSLPSPGQSGEENNLIATPKSTPRSKSVRQKSNNKVWSFGDMAKAVGCGVTAFGSNVVNSSKAVGSGVYHGSKAVGNNVVQGTKAAGKMTKDVTIAAGKGVVEVGEHMAVSTVEVGKVVTSASVNAVQDTTNWIIEQTDLEGSGTASSQNVHVVLPGEDLAEISKVYSVPAHKLIKVNSLRHRKLIPGKEIIIPKKDSQESETHPMTSVTLSCVINNSTKAKVVFSVKEVLIIPAPKVQGDVVVVVDNNDDDHDESRLFSFAWRKIKYVVFQKINDDEIPELLSVDEIPECVGLAATDAGSHDDEEVVVAAGSHETDVRLTLLDPEDQILTKIRLSSNQIGQINSFLTLWYPEKLHPDSDTSLIADRKLTMGYEEEEEIPFVFDDLICNSQILSKSLMEDIHSAMNLKTQSSKWRIVYSTILDGYSLQNFYRKVATCNEPFLLVIQDDEDDVFGAFLTCTPTITEEFLGTGESWLFGVKDGALKVYEWSKKNEYFFQGKTNCVIIGACDGKFGIFMDGNFHHGRLDECGTFLDWPEQVKDIKVKCFECFNFE